MSAPDATGPRRQDAEGMGRALEVAERVRGLTAPNPWVGAAVGTGADGGEDWFTGATAPPGGPHAEVVALRAAGARARSGTLYVTLEPCTHQGRTPPCTDAIISSGIQRVVVGVEDPDPRVSGRGIAALRSAGLPVEVGVEADRVADQLSGYLKHRRTGRPGVTLKLASTLDGFTAAPDGSSRWITGETARRDVHRMRARADAVLVGAGTVRADDPSLTVRLPRNDPYFRGPDEQPARVVLGRAPAAAAVRPAIELQGGLGEVLDELGRRGVLELLVEGGATVAHAFHSDGLVDRYVLYLAPALLGGDDGRPLFVGPGAPRLTDLWRGRVHSVTSLEGDLRVDLLPDTPRGAMVDPRNT
ncbi:MAG: bifunctional diaminohydroxyphosphoribosylaminopyrimidine deaminase/5-amino-6-(5-phosphoribosylamino)uracil reductase RibD [Acidimicrobiales bacterium]